MRYDRRAKRGPTRLVTGAQTHTVVAVEELVEQEMVLEVRVGLHLLGVPEARAASARVLYVDLQG